MRGSDAPVYGWNDSASNWPATPDRYMPVRKVRGFIVVPDSLSRDRARAPATIVTPGSAGLACAYALRTISA